jgi:voltage-gated potassium channel
MFRGFLLRFVIVAAVAVALTVVGVVGYMSIQGWGFHDALYMTAITLTAVGYEEVRPLSLPGQYFTMVLLLGGITLMGLFFAFTAALMVELNLTEHLRRRRKMKQLEEIRDHVIICGTGLTGLQVMEEFWSLGQPFVALERDQGRIDDLLEDFPDALIIHADATHDEKLEQAGISRARGLVACLSADADNLFVCLSARALRPDLMIVARGYEEDTMNKLYRAGANHVISPNITGAIQMASFILRPSVMGFLDVATRSPDLALRLEEARIGKGSAVVGKTLAQARIPQETGLIVIALRKADAAAHEFVFNPVASTLLEDGDTLVALGSPQQVTALRRYVEH